MFKLKLFLISFLLTTGVLLAVIYAHRPKLPPKLDQVRSGVYVASQLRPENIRLLGNVGFTTIVDVRPDGEDKNQTPSVEIERATKDRGMNFHYIPVPHETIPASAVTALDDVLFHKVGSAVLYCRTGRRAVRLFALVEASRADGPDADAIIEMVRTAGFSATDLRDNITRRISNRSSTPAVEK